MIGSIRSSGGKSSKAKTGTDSSKKHSNVLKSTATRRQMAEIDDGDDDDLANTGSSEEESIKLPKGINEN